MHGGVDSLPYQPPKQVVLAGSQTILLENGGTSSFDIKALNLVETATRV